MLVHSSTMAAAVEGMSFFTPLMTFDPKTASAIMAGLLLSDLLLPESAAKPGVKLDQPYALFHSNSFPGGGWRCAYSGESVGPMSLLIGKLGGYGTVRF